MAFNFLDKQIVNITGCTTSAINGTVQTDISNLSYSKIMTLTLRKGCLLKGETYTFRLDARYGNSKGYAFISHRVPLPPRHGYFEVVPYHAESLGTLYLFRSFAWIDRVKRIPLQYRFGYYNDNGKHFLTGWKGINVASMMLPSGTVKTFTEVKNNLEIVEINQEIRLSNSTLSNASAIEWSLMKTLDRKDIGAASNFIRVALSISSRNSTHLTAYVDLIKKCRFSEDFAIIAVDTLHDISLWARQDPSQYTLRENIAQAMHHLVKEAGKETSKEGLHTFQVS